jgi:hypothetical protein
MVEPDSITITVVRSCTALLTSHGYPLLEGNKQRFAAATFKILLEIRGIKALASSIL